MPLRTIDRAVAIALAAAPPHPLPAQQQLIWSAGVVFAVSGSLTAEQCCGRRGTSCQG
jgi:hypothetical protein